MQDRITHEFITNSPSMTEDLAAGLAGLLKEGDIITLDGDLGAGKTCFTRGLARGLGSDDPVSSPTFTIVNEYEGGKLSVFHFDTYRLGGEDDFLDSGLDEYFYRGGVCVIEWSDVIGGLIPDKAIRININGTGDTRSFNMSVPDEDRFKKIPALIEEICR